MHCDTVCVVCQAVIAASKSARASEPTFKLLCARCNGGAVLSLPRALTPRTRARAKVPR
jgi:hypothetical protein